MTVETHNLVIPTRGNAELVDLTPELRERLRSGSIREGIVVVHCVGSTGAITTTEFEPGLVNEDFRALFEKLAPEDGTYAHEEMWKDDNGHSHLRASLVGPSVTLPVVGGEPVLGTWQQVVLMDFDTRPRQRPVVLQVMGE
jgi:secondary thiamine-phosphate synthase enzyme